MYKDKIIYIATKHKKEKAIKASFESLLSCKIRATKNFDTDQFGTFSGEIERKLSPYETCIKKAKHACEKYNIDYVVSSEGSFGPHPTMFFVPADTEILVFFDRVKNIIISEHIISNKTNYAHHNLSESDNFNDFLEKIHFPSHKVILKDTDSNAILGKAIDNYSELLRLVKKHKKSYSSLRIETDMRAHCNPTRMNVLKELSEKLANRIATRCPECQTPGFGQVKLTGNLNCEACGTRTNLYKSKTLTCVQCEFKKELGRDDGLLQAAQDYCPFCNP